MSHTLSFYQYVSHSLVLSVCFTLSHSLLLSIYLTFSRSVCTWTHTISFCLYVSHSLAFCLYVSHSISLSVCLSISRFVCMFHTLSFCLNVSLNLSFVLYVCLTLPLPLFISPLYMSKFVKKIIYFFFFSISLVTICNFRYLYGRPNCKLTKTNRQFKTNSVSY